MKYSWLVVFTLASLAGKDDKATMSNYYLGRDVIHAFHGIEESPSTINYTNAREVNSQGGHLQGVQSMRKNGQEYVLLSGSSSTYSYYAVVRVGEKNEVLSVNKIREKPYKHAGGFQIYEKYMAIGIEDDEAKDKSDVYIYQIDDPERPPRQPIAVIKRTGEPKRATAGCVAITTVRGKMLIVVSDWDSRHVDFYASDPPKSDASSWDFKRVYTINAATIDKKGWVNSNWLSYQNINLLKGEEGDLYLIGFAQAEKGEGVADLFRVETDGLAAYELKKVATKTFQTKNGTSFKWGAGVQYNPDEARMKILSCTAQMGQKAFLSEYQ